MTGNQKMPVSRRLLVTFTAVMALVVAMLLWWITFNILAAREQHDDRLHLLESQRTLAADMIVLAAQLHGPTGSLPGAVLARTFQSLRWGEGAFTHPQLNGFYPGYGVFVRPEVLRDLDLRREARVRMFLSEGGFFLAMVLAGAWLIFRTLRHEVALMRQQANFLSAVTHELKSPLASIRLYTETMQLRDSPPETRKRYLAAMRGDVDRLETLVGNLLAVARLDAGQFIVHARRIDFVHEVGTVVRAIGHELADRGFVVTLDAPHEALWVQADAGALHTVMRNLLDNAAKYGGTAKQAAVRIFQDGACACACVTDRGIGIEAAELPHIFRKFYRVGDEMVRQSEGSGLGLYLVQALVQQSGGTVSARSDGPGRGTIFEIRIPLTRTEGA